MAAYRIVEFTLEKRAEAALQMLIPYPSRKRGLGTQLARQYGISRTLLYKTRDRVRDVIFEALQPREAGRPAQTNTLTVDKALVDQTIATFPVLKGSVRDIRLGLSLILGVTRSVGYISKKLNEAGQQATLNNQGISIPLPILGEADEIFKGRQPCLTVVDGRSFLVVNLTSSAKRDATTWGVTYLELMERGIQFQDLASDGGTGLLAGAREAQLNVPLRPDLFHLMRDAYRVSQRLERVAYRAIETAERARRAEKESQGLIRRRGPRLKIETPLSQAEIEQRQAITTFDVWNWLLAEIRQALEPLTPSGKRIPLAKAQDSLETAIELLQSLGHKEISAFASVLQTKMSQLLAPLQWLEQQLLPVLNNLEIDAQSFILWAWQHRQALKVNIDSDIPTIWQETAHTLWDSLGLFHRSSSIAESLHSWLRPYLEIHRGMPNWLLPLLQFFWNHHRFERGKRAGNSPLELAGVENVPSLAEAFGQLLCPNPSTLPV